MLTLQQLVDSLHAAIPPRLAEDWDNVGLLIGDAAQPVQRIMTCLTVTPTSALEAVQERADVIVTHHPFPFRPLKRITAESTVGRLLLQLISAGIAVHSPHTAFDSAAAGINQRLASDMGLAEIRPLVPLPDSPDQGAGRRGVLPQPVSVGEIAQRLKSLLRIPGVQHVGRVERPIRSVAVACGSGGSFLPAAHAAGCDLFVTGEATFHTCLEAEALGVDLLLPGHYASERFAVERLAEVLAETFPLTTVWASRTERDPLEWIA